MKHLIVIAALIPAGIAHADVTPEQLTRDYAAAGYSRIEIKTGPTQTKVEAWNSTTKVETIHDTRSGAVLKSETEALHSGTVVVPGVSVRERNRDFVDGFRAAGLDDDDHGGKGRGRGRGGDDGPGDDNGGRGRGSDDGPGDDRSGRGSDDAPGDDNGGRGRGSDDGPGDDRSGRGSDDAPGDDNGGRGRGSDD
jgi:hypothetical protein